MGDEIVILAVEGRAQPMGVATEPGHRVPLVPPLGTVFVAWSEPDVVDHWLDGLGAGTDPERIDRYRKAVAAVRTRGYAMGLEGHGGDQLTEALAGLGRSTGSERVRGAVAELLRELEREQDDYLLTTLEGSAQYQLGILSAPVFDADGQVVLALTLMGFGRPLTASQVPGYATPLLEATRAVTQAVHGRDPDAGDGHRTPP
jgi:DNA-binding IclR family transcriptional regulator